MRAQVGLGRVLRQAVARVRGRHPDRAEDRRQGEGLERFEDAPRVRRLFSLQSVMSAVNFLHDRFIAFKFLFLRRFPPPSL